MRRIMTTTKLLWDHRGYRFGEWFDWELAPERVGEDFAKMYKEEDYEVLLTAAEWNEIQEKLNEIP